MPKMMLYAAICFRAKGEPPTRHKPTKSTILIGNLLVGPYPGSMVQSATERASREDIADATADTEASKIILHNTVAHERSEQANTEALLPQVFLTCHDMCVSQCPTAAVVRWAFGPERVGSRKRSVAYNAELGGC